MGTYRVQTNLSVQTSSALYDKLKIKDNKEQVSILITL